MAKKKSRKTGSAGTTGSAAEAADGHEATGTHAGPRPGSKRQRAEARQRQARQRAMRRRAVRIVVASLLIVIPALMVFDRSGAEQVVDATVIETQQYPHFNDSGKHMHTRATILVDGQSEQKIERADDFVRGQRVKVWAKVGRITGWPYFNDLVKPEELAELAQTEDSDSQQAASN